MYNILVTMFAWPMGIVVGNLIASALTSVAMLVYHHWKFRSLHERIRRLEDRYHPVTKDAVSTLETRLPEE